MAFFYISGQLGTAQLGLAQLGQFQLKSFTPGSIVIRGAAEAPIEVTVTALSAGAKLNTPGLAAAPDEGVAYRYFAPDLLGFQILLESIDPDYGVDVGLY
jgi:hypothetical protein